jgi:hypothetical protein
VTEADELVIMANPDEGSSLGYLLRLPINGGLVFRTADTWPRTKALFCYPMPSDAWPVDGEVVERVPLRSCVRRGAAIDVVADRPRENRSQIVFTRARGREVVFWQSPRTRKQARPNVALPSARAAVERKSPADLVSSVTDGKLRYALGDLAALPRAAVVVEDRYSALFKQRHVRPSVVADALAEYQVRWPTVPIVFCETRPLAEEWTYRFLAAAWRWAGAEPASQDRTGIPDLVLPGAPDQPEPSVAEVRAWARTAGFTVPDRGRLRPEIWTAWRNAHDEDP